MVACPAARAEGCTVDFKNTVIVMPTILGSQMIQQDMASIIR
jgi:ATP-dependent Clp protease ATP-binding subunit ClpA